MALGPGRISPLPVSSPAWVLRDISTGQLHTSLCVSMPGCILTAVLHKHCRSYVVLPQWMASHTSARHPSDHRASCSTPPFLTPPSTPWNHEIFKSQRSHAQTASPPDHAPHVHGHCCNRPLPVVPKIPAVTLELAPLPPGLISSSICATTRAAFIKQKWNEVTPFRYHHLIISPSPPVRNTCGIEFKFLDAYKFLTFGFSAFHAWLFPSTLI